ncbi:MAG TPA: RNA methyltransferase [Burkholderiaceae bacterium]|nr:RNA methyltransferase [Burkholderiaceae bacterium]
MLEAWREIAAIREQLRRLGATRAHQDRVLRLWLHAMAQDAGRRRIEDFLPRTLREALPASSAALAGLARIASRHPAQDGSERLLVALGDGRTIESVLLPAGGLCISTQVGCAVGCIFCMTGRGGLSRQLGSAEITAQLALARSLRPVRRVVFMGMGEPAHNLDAVLEAVELLGTAGGIGHKSLVVSTVGDARLFDRLLALRAGDVRPALAISLHSTQAAKRAELLPRAQQIAPAELVESGERYARAAGHPIQYQWTLIDGVNDGDDEVDAIAALLAGRHAMMNLIPYNAVDGLALRRPPADRAAAIARALNRRGVLTRLRRSAGQDVDAGCGQLRARSGGAVIPPHASR